MNKTADTYDIQDILDGAHNGYKDSKEIVADLDEWSTWLATLLQYLIDFINEIKNRFDL